MFAPRRWIIASLCAALAASGQLREGEVSGPVPILRVSFPDRVVAQGDDVPPPPVVPDPEENPDTETATEEPAGGLSPGARNQLVSALVGTSSPNEFWIRVSPTTKFGPRSSRRPNSYSPRFREPPLPIPESRDVSLNEEQDKAVEGLLTLAFEAAGGPTPEAPPPPQVPCPDRAFRPDHLPGREGFLREHPAQGHLADTRRCARRG